LWAEILPSGLDESDAPGLSADLRGVGGSLLRRRRLYAMAQREDGVSVTVVGRSGMVCWRRWLHCPIAVDQSDSRLSNCRYGTFATTSAPRTVPVSARGGSQSAQAHGDMGMGDLGMFGIYDHHVGLRRAAQPLESAAVSGRTYITDRQRVYPIACRNLGSSWPAMPVDLRTRFRSSGPFGTSTEAVECFPRC